MPIWPGCFSRLTEAGKPLAEPPAALLAAFGAAPLPVRLLRALGRCATSLYEDCPHIPEHHLDNADEDPGWFREVGMYYAYDLEMSAGDGQVIPLRLIFNEGCGDTNDGLWGEIWNGDTGVKLGWIDSTGDCESLLCVSPEAAADFQPLGREVPGEEVALGFFRLATEHDSQFERLLRVAVLLAYDHRSS